MISPQFSVVLATTILGLILEQKFKLCQCESVRVFKPQRGLYISSLALNAEKPELIIQTSILALHVNTFAYLPQLTVMVVWAVLVLLPVAVSVTVYVFAVAY